MIETDPTTITAEDELALDEAGETAAAEAETGGAAPAAPVAEPATDGAVADAATIAYAEPATEEPSVAGDLDLGQLAALGAPVPKLPIFPVTRRVAGTYRSIGAPFRVELRVDVDGARPTRRVSADYYVVAGGTVTYFGSMRLDALSLVVSPTLVTITGIARYTWAAANPRVRIAIPRVPPIVPAAPATLQHLNASGTPMATYVCRWASPHFRTVLLEQDCESTVPAPFASYNTASLPSGGPARTLTVQGAFAEAGIQTLSTGATNVVNTSESVDGKWSDAELHAAMMRHFSRWRDIPQWAVWLFHAFQHDRPTLLGIMFDLQGKQRQGCAVFYRGLAGTTADRLRLQLYTCVHELGHCFNLLHSWQKSLATPPAPNRPGSPSWMNYPWFFPGGEAAFWTAFPFAFDLPELVHLRHAFRDDVVMGGKPFGVGAALEDARDEWREPDEDDSGLRLEISAPSAFPLGAPVSIDIALSGSGSRGKIAPRHLRPRDGTIEVAIEQPGGRALLYRPLLEHCAPELEPALLSADTPPIEETAFIHYGKDGFYFDQSGRYRIRARLTAPDGSNVISNVLDIRVRSPITAEDEEAAELLLGEEQGALLSLVGSDYDGLARGNEALDRLIEEHGEHPLAAYARVVQATNAAREFKHVAPDATVSVREPRPEEAARLIAPILDVDGVRDASAAHEGDPAAMRAEAMAFIRGDAPRPDTAPDLRAFLRARRREIAEEMISLGS